MSTATAAPPSAQQRGILNKLLDNSELQGSGFGYPYPLPGDRGILFISCTSGCATMSLRVFDMETKTQHLLLNEAGQAWYLPTGHVLYTRRDGTLLAAPFDLKTLQLTGAGVPVLSNVLVTFGFAQFAWSPSGTIVYATGRGPEYYDVETIDRIVKRLEDNDGRFSALLMGVVDSAPFQKMRTQATMTVAN